MSDAKSHSLRGDKHRRAHVRRAARSTLEVMRCKRLKT